MARRRPSRGSRCLFRGSRIARPAGHLASFQGVLQVDGYNGFKRLAGDRADASVRLAFCWAHMRRGFYDFLVERAIRPIPMTRKAALFAGSEGGARHWAIAMTLIQSAKLNGVEPMAYLTDVLERSIHPGNAA